MKHRFKLALTISLTMMLLVSSPSKALNVSVALEVGDKHEFTIHDLQSKSIINGTDYSPTDNEVKKGDKIQTEITGFTDEGGSSTYVNFTQTVGGTSEDVSSEVDSWQYFFIFAFIAFLAPVAWESGELDFGEPEEEDELTVDAEGLPLFATNDEDTYIAFDDDEITSAEFSQNVNGNITEQKVVSDLDTAENTYSFRYYFHFVYSGKVDGEDASLDLSLDLIGDIDYGRSLVTRLKVALIWDIVVGSATSELAFVVDIYEGDNKPGGDDEGGLAGLPVNPLAVLFGITGLAMVSRKIRK